MALLDRVCKECKKKFKGGPRAYYCSLCRQERAKVTGREHKRKKRQGLTRALGSIDNCERCGKKYVVEGGNQRFCPECQPIHAAEHDRATSIEFYHQNKDRINPIRYKRRRIDPIRPCVVCGTNFEHCGKRTITCSDKCKRTYRNKRFRSIYYPRIMERHKGRIRAIQRWRNRRVSMLREVFGLCPHCGEEWTEPKLLRGYRPRYCKKCQDYYLNRTAEKARQD